MPKEGRPQAKQALSEEGFDKKERMTQ